MTPFRVQCETCQSWLKVREEGLMNQIHACPKCGGMVHLVPTEEASTSAQALPAASAEPEQTPGANEFDSVDDLGLDAPAESVAEPAAPTPEQVAAAQPATESATPAAPTPDTQTPGASTPDVPTPEQLFRPAPAESLGRKVAMGVGAGGTVLVLVGGLIYYLTSGNSDNDTQAAVTKSPAQIEEPAKPVEVTALKPTEPRPEAPPTAPAKPVTSEPVTPALPSLPEQDPDPQPTAPVVTPQAEPTEPDPQPAPTEPPAEESETPAIDPLDYDPASLDLVLLKNPKKKDRPAVSTPPPAAPGADLDAKLASKSDDPQRVASLDKKLANRAQDERVWVERSPTALEPHGPINLAQRLNEQVPELYLPGAPLSYSVRLWSDLAGVPVTIDPQALARAGVGTRTKVTLKGRDAKLSDILTGALRPLRLSYEERGDQLVIARLGAEQPMTRPYEVADLLPAGVEDASPLVQLAERLALSAESGAKLTPDGTKLSLSGPARTHFDLAIFCERLRRVRRLPQRTKYPPSLLPVKPSLAELSPTLDRTVTFSFVSPTPLVDVVEHWRRTSKLEILVDWSSMSDMQVGPRTLLRCSAREASWRESLDGVLSPLGLGWRAVDGRTIQIGGTAAMAQANPRTEFYPLSKPSAGSAVAQAMSERTTGLSAVVHFDKPSGALIVRGVDAVQRSIFDSLLESGQVE